MKAYVATFSGKTFGDLSVYPSRILASQSGNYGTIFSSEEDLLRSSVSMDQMVSFYNYHTQKAPIKKFEDREKASRRIFALAQTKAVEKSKITLPPEEKETIMFTIEKNETQEIVKKVAKIKKEKSAEPKNKSAGRKSEFYGKKFHAIYETNHRRENTHGHKSFQIILDNGFITYDDFISKNGRAVDLRWDIKNGKIQVLDI